MCNGTIIPRQLPMRCKPCVGFCWNSIGYNKLDDCTALVIITTKQYYVWMIYAILFNKKDCRETRSCTLVYFHLKTILLQSSQLLLLYMCIYDNVIINRTPYIVLNIWIQQQLLNFHMNIVKEISKDCRKFYNFMGKTHLRKH